ncbi:hypothetical protein JYB64_06920 [Algoriphagus aestuarii]|nr:hypothetical protein [Algoriphagus aestuarii]
MRRNLFILLILGFLFGLQSCGENSELGKTEVYWDQTGCADPWEVSIQTSDEELKFAILAYLKSEGVKNARVKRISDEAQTQVCLACFCTTGKRFHIEVPKNQKSKILSLGFKEK